MDNCRERRTLCRDLVVYYGLRLVRAFPSLIATVLIFFARKFLKRKEWKKKEREDVNYIKFVSLNL